MSPRQTKASACVFFILATAIGIQSSKIELLGTGTHALLVTGAIVLSVIGVLLLIQAFDRKHRSALFRIDFFLPQIRRRAAGDYRATNLLGRWVRHWIPTSWQSNWQDKKRGPIRLLLRKLGLSWVASPLRRVIQSVCLFAFLVLFFYVCWPYHAKPLAPPSMLVNCRPVILDQQSGDFIVTLPSNVSHVEAKPWLAKKLPVYVAFYTGGSSLKQEDSIGFFTVVTTELTNQLRLCSNAELAPEHLNRILTNPVGFDIYERNPDAWPTHYADNLASKEKLSAEFFLIIDPLVSLSTAIASRSWVVSLVSAAAILLVCVLIPRGFCGYICPLGTTIDLFDWVIGRRIKKFRVSSDGWWVHIKYYLLSAILVAAVFGVLLSGMFAAIPVITRGVLFLLEPFQNGLLRGWHLVPSMNAGQLLSILLFFGVLALGFLQPRFWCKYVCPSGAVFSLGNLFRISERKVENSCIHCNKCIEICPFDAIKPDFTTRGTDCTLCQSCGGVCPTHAIKFVERWNVVELKTENDPPTGETTLGRRGFLSLATGSAAAVVGGTTAAISTAVFGARLDMSDPFLPIRPPGSVPEQEFLQMCIRCGECFKVCPNNVLQPEGFEQGFEGLWAPLVRADWAGCESSCNACGQVCPTGAIRPLPMEEKRYARMGLAIVNEQSCLPFAGKEDCDLCVQECNAAGYHAIEYVQVGTQMDQAGLPIEGTGFLAPVVLQDHCVGCGLCQTRCYAINVKEKQLLGESAIIIRAGEGKEDRLMDGSYRELRRQEENQRVNGKQHKSKNVNGYFIPEELPTAPNSPSKPSTSNEFSDPFGLGEN